MKIWYQTYTPVGREPRLRKYEEDLKSYVRKIARPGTTVEVHGVAKMAPKMTESDYLQYMHIGQVIEAAMQAEREGYDAFCIGGTLDLGHIFLKDAVDIPVAFIAESSFLNACLLARKFGIVGINGRILQRQMELVKYHGLEQRCVPGVHLDNTLLGLVELSEKDPDGFIEMFREASRKLIADGAGAIIPGYGAIGAFFGTKGIHDVDGVPIVDIVAVVLKTAETLVDLKALGVNRSRKGFYSYADKKDMTVARKLYGIE